jgi:diguanylate cyclase (GGDEF)-like protein
MQSPGWPSNEKSRLIKLHTTKLLDTVGEERFDRVTRLAKRIFGVEMALISLIDENRQWFKSCAGTTLTETPRDISFCAHTILGEEPFIIPDASTDQRFNDNPLVTSSPNIRFYAGVPLMLDSEFRLGTLCIVDDKPRHLTKEEINDLIDLAKLAERELVTTYQATLDELTSISNRRGFKEFAAQSVRHCSFANVDYALIYLDLNQFKEINDRLGHSTGDQALRDFAELLRHSFRESDVVARVGGDEFVVLMSDCNQREAELAVERFNQTLSDYNKQTAYEFTLSMTAGVVVCKPTSKFCFEELLDLADQAMYRNRALQKA